MVNETRPAPTVEIKVDVTDWTESQRARLLGVIDNFQDEMDPASRPRGETSEWDEDSFVKAWGGIRAAGAVAQTDCIRLAVRNGGFISREEVYQVSDYPPDRSLRGFTRPVNRIVQELRDRGDLPEDCAELLDPIYDPDVSGYQQTKGFRVPQELLTIFETWELEHRLVR